MSKQHINSNNINLNLLYNLTFLDVESKSRGEAGGEVAWVTRMAADVPAMDDLKVWVRAISG